MILIWILAEKSVVPKNVSYYLFGLRAPAAEGSNPTVPKQIMSRTVRRWGCSINKKNGQSKKSPENLQNPGTA